MKLISLNMAGVAHFVALAVVVVGAGLIGTYTLVQSHADSTSINCNPRGVKYVSKYPEYNCSFYKAAPVVNTSRKTVGTNHSGTNWILCQVGGYLQTSGKYFNNWWGYTKADNGKFGWVSGVYGNGGVNTASAPYYSKGSFGGVPQCYTDNSWGTSLHSFSSAAPGTYFPGTVQGK